MFIIKNEMKLKKFVRKYLQSESGVYDFDFIKRDVIFSYYDGDNGYEISRFESKDGITHKLPFYISLGYDETIIEF